MFQNCMSADWLIHIGKEVGDERLGIRVDHITSGNDGDVCISFITYSLLQCWQEPNCIDIGAEQGWWSMFCAKYHRNAKIKSFEPNPYSYQTASQNVSKYPSIQIFECAISDSKGELPFTIAEGESNSRSPSDCKVKCDTLNTFLSEDELIHIMKVDTEGHEHKIVRAMEPLFPRIYSMILEFSVYWYGETFEECMQNSLQMLETLSRHFPMIYVVSRRGSPVLYGPLPREQHFNLIQNQYKSKVQFDIVASKIPIPNIQIIPLR